MSEATSQQQSSSAIDLASFMEPFVQGEVEFDPAATQSGPPPVPEAKEGLIVNLKFAKENPAEQWSVVKDGSGQPKCLQTDLIAEVLHGDSEGRKIRASFVNTESSQFDKTTRVNLICQALGDGVTAEEVAQHGSHKAQAVKLTQLLGPEGATLKVFNQWQAKWLVDGDSGKKESLRDRANKVIMLKGAGKSGWPKDASGHPKSIFTLGEAFPEYAGSDYADVPARVDSVIVRFAPAVN